MPIHTAYVRHRENLPDTINSATAMLGFDELGMKIKPFYGFGDIETDVDCGPEALVHGFITGLLWTGVPWQRLHLAPYEKSTPTYFSEPVHFLSEYRCYILEGEILGVRFYKGDWSVAPCRRIVRAAVEAYAPYRAYAIDVGVLMSGKTVVVEVNDAFALGCYGLHHVAYARMIEARWEELTGSL